MSKTFPRLMLAVAVAVLSIAWSPATPVDAGYSGPAAYYATGYTDASWNAIFEQHRAWGNVVSGGTRSPNGYWCVHPWHSPGEVLTVYANGTSITCTIGDTVQSHHQSQWLAKWAIELSWNAFTALGLHVNNWVSVSPGGFVVEATPEPPRVRTFAEVEYTITGEFLDFWETNGGLMIFGFPLEEPHDDNGMTIQTFERAVFEDHGDRVMLRRIGAHLLGHTD